MRSPAIHRRPDWALPSRLITPETVALNRRAFLTGGAALLMTPTGVGAAPVAEAVLNPAPPRNPAFADAGRALTPEAISAAYNNFYEFASHKKIAEKAQALRTEGWTIRIDGLVEKPLTLSMDDLAEGWEERIYRHRCVEAWSMVVPWIGFPLRRLVERARPLSGAKYLRFETFHDPKIAPGQRANWSPWPYVEGLTMAEATHDLAFMVTGAYGKALHKQFGAPIRLHLPWKYGFKSIKSIVRISFTEQRPVSFWEALQEREYGFWANVNPKVDHPRWSQATEEVLGTGNRVPTLLFNGYAEQVAGLYAGLQDQPLWR